MNRVNEVIYCFWTGDNPLTQNRIDALKSMQDNLEVPIECLDKDKIKERELKDSPYHPAYPYLSAVHKADYLRCYFMHHFGGGYADIKHYTKQNNWKKCFEKINCNSEIDVIGQQETITGGRRPIYNTVDGASRLIATCYFICRPKSDFTNKWYALTMRKLDEKLAALKAHPAQSPFDRSPEYPLKWVELLGMIFHDLVFETSFLNPYSIRRELITGRDNEKPYR